MKIRHGKKLLTPLSKEQCSLLRAGDWVLLSGKIYTARDQAHKRIEEAIERNQRLPFSFTSQIIYYCGPTPGRPEAVIGSAGPTTSSRMDKYLEQTLKLGVLATLGKGERSEEAKKLFKRYGAVYLVTIGGAGAYLSSRIKQAKIKLWPELGPEAVYELIVEDFPCLVAYDCLGGDYFTDIRRRFLEVNK